MLTPERENPGGMLLLVDGFNLLHSVILKGRERAEWWRAENQNLVLELVAQYPENVERWVVFDAGRIDSARTVSEGAVKLWFAPDADAWILGQIKTLRPRRVVLVSADRSLQDRARELGAERMSPWQFSAALTHCHEARLFNA